MFCQLEVLRHCFPSSVRHILGELPESLDETYERILREIRKPNQGHAHRLLQCLVAAVRPLRVQELAEVLAFDFDVEGIPKLNLGWRWENREEAVMSACSSLVMIVKDGDSRVVQFSHFSVREYLTANRLAHPIKDVSRYHIRLEAAHTVLVQACLGVLLRLDDRVDSGSIKNFPLAKYAAQYWPTHARYENASSRVEDGMKCLFDAYKPHFATWLWIYNEDRSWNPMSTSTRRPEEPGAVPLYYASKLGLGDLVGHLVTEHRWYVNARGGMEVTPIHAAASEGHVDILAVLLEHGADLDGQGVCGETPLHRAFRNGQLKAGNYLLDRGAYVNARDNSDQTPLTFAVMRGDAQAVQLLLEHGADANVRDESGRTLSQLTRKREILKLLSDYGVKSIK